MSGAPALRAQFDTLEDVSEWPDLDLSILRAGRSTPPPMPSKLFGGLWPVIADLAEGAGSPVDYVAVSVLAVAASLIGARRRVQPFLTTPQWQEPCVLWIGQVGDPSSNKSPGLDSATTLLQAFEEEYANEHKEALRQYETMVERANAERAQWKDQIKTATKENIATPSMPDAAALPDEPVRRRFVVRDATPEAMGEILSGNVNGTLHLRDELAGWLMSFERYSPGGREFWLEAYGGRPHVIDRKSQKSGPVIIPFNGVTVLGGIQPEKLSATLLNGVDDGLVARFIWAWPDSIPYHRPQTVADISILDDVYRRLIGLSPPHIPGQPNVLLLSADAADIFEAWVAENGDVVRDAASLYKGFCGKLRGTVLRIALVAELIRWAVSGRVEEPNQVSAETLVSAIEFIEDYAKPSARRVFGDAALPEAERNAASLAKHIIKNKLQTVNLRAVRRGGDLPQLNTAEKVDDAAALLVEAGWIKRKPISSVGRPNKDFVVNVAVHEVDYG